MSQILILYYVTLPSWVVWPGKVTLHVSYTYAAAQQFIDDYPNKFLTGLMNIEPKEMIIHTETD